MAVQIRLSAILPLLVLSSAVWTTGRFTGDGGSEL